MPVQRILVKAAGGVPAAALSFDGAQVNFAATPLFASIERPGALGAAAASRWYVLTPPPGFAEPNPWDVCHQVLQQGFGIAGAAAPEFAEPDLEQQWLAGDDGQLGLMLAGPCGAAEQQDPDFPRDPNPFWFRDPAHSQFDAALAKIGGPDVAAKVRIAHLDTGYDPDHKTLPKRLRRDLARNFVDADRPNDATDTSGGLLNNLGHGTGTLSILAGAGVGGGLHIGAAPFAEVVPVRVANRVVLFSNSAIAQAFDYIHSLGTNPAKRVDIITMSMGGVASQAWADAVNALYEQGVFIVTAAGNNISNLPTRNIVYPARFRRVVAACGVMANHTPYADLALGQMAGNYGPSSKMGTAVSAATPNTPWAKLGCSTIVDLNGAGTSAATPQVAAAAAIWVQQNRAQFDKYPQPWMRVEAIRKALFEGADENAAERERLGRGELRARKALDQPPAPAASLTAERRDSAAFPIFRILTGLGLDAAADPRQQMIELEALQLSQRAGIERLLPDPEAPPDSISATTRRQLAEALISYPGASQALRQALGKAEREKTPSMFFPQTSNAIQKLHLKQATKPPIPKPSRRPLRVYTYDPSLGARLQTLDLNETIIDVRWEEDLQPGPVGEYLEVIDIDPASRCCYAPIDLNHPHLLTQSGLSPSEANPQFHQQMTYAVAMRTIEHFEHALGRVALWAPRRVRDVNGRPRDRFVRKLRIYPHALRAKNAYYSPDRKALLLGYFKASQSDPGDVLPGGVVFTAVSHDIIAHETTHALLDGLHRRFREPTNKDVLAFHEAFADIVALFQHFTLPSALRAQIRQTQGNLERQNLLAQLAVQFGQATGRYGALRDAIGKTIDGQWQPQKPDPKAYENATEAHDLGAVLVAAVFDAFLQIYKRRTADLIRLATGGTGILPEGDITADLVDRLAEEASKVAGHILNMCIRALDYCPPVDLTFGEYLRALITADADLVPNDKRGYRTAFVAAFRNRGIYPGNVKHLSPASLIWEPPPLPLETAGVKEVLSKMSLDWDLSVDREHAYDLSRRNAAIFQRWLMNAVSDDEIDALGLIRKDPPLRIGGVDGTLGGIEVHSVRPARRIGPDGQSRSDLVVEITQTFRAKAPGGGRYRGGCTLLIDLDNGEVRYLIRKRVTNAERLAAQQAFAGAMVDDLRKSYFGTESLRDEPFALLHRAHH